MRTAARILGVVGALALCAGLTAAQNTNDMPYNNDTDIVYIFGDPTSGASCGTNPPDIVLGDYFWKVTPREALGCMGFETTIGWDGWWEEVYDTDWTTQTCYNDRIFGNAYNDALFGLCTRVPSWLFAPFSWDGSELFISLGLSTLPNPCSTSPLPGWCTSYGGCPQPGYVVGYQMLWTWSAPFQIACNQDHAYTYFFEGGQVFTSDPSNPGQCGLGDMMLQSTWSTNETQADIALHPAGLGCSGPEAVTSGWYMRGYLFTDGLNEAPGPHLTFGPNIINLIARGDGPTGTFLRNGSNALCFDDSDGLASIAVQYRDALNAGDPTKLGISAISITGLIPAPGLPFLGGWIGIVPDGIVNSTLSSGPIVATTSWAGTEGDFTGPTFPMPVVVPPYSLYAQGFVLDVLAFTLDETPTVTTYVP